MHSLRKIRRVTIERTWEVIGTGGMHECIPYGTSRQIPICLFVSGGGKEFLHIFQKALDFPPGGRFIL